MFATESGRPCCYVVVSLTILKSGDKTQVILSRLSKILIKRFKASTQYDVISSNTAHCLDEEQNSEINQSIHFLTAFPMPGD